MRTATQTKLGRTVTMTASDMAFGRVSGYHLAECGIPAHLCDTAAATCRIQLMGWHKGNHNGTAPRNAVKHPLSGRWAHIQLATYGHRPGNNWRGSDRGRYIHADNFAAVDTILGCFDGITTEEVIEWATSGDGLQPDDHVQTTLREVVEGLRPQLTALDAMLDRADNATEARQALASR